MDQGSFILEAEEQRWAIDLGAEAYAKTEAAISDFWSMSQNSRRWSLTRYNNLSHNTLTFSSTYPTFTPARQNVNSKATFISHSDAPHDRYVSIDLTPVYTGISGVAVNNVQRAVAMIANRYSWLSSGTSGKLNIKHTYLSDAGQRSRTTTQRVNIVTFHNLFCNGGIICMTILSIELIAEEVSLA